MFACGRIYYALMGKTKNLEELPKLTQMKHQEIRLKPVSFDEVLLLINPHIHTARFIGDICPNHNLVVL